MFKPSPSRSHRSKGFKVKHFLQLCLLLAICFWLIYQIKRSQLKTKGFDSKYGKVSRKDHTGNTRRLGRKGLPTKTEMTDVEKQGKDEEQKDEPDKDDKHEEGDVDGDEDDGGDGETYENDPDRADVDPEHEEESLDGDIEMIENETLENEDVGNGIDDSENEEKKNVGKKADKEGNVASKDDERHGVDPNTHKARDKQYKADDASSEVAHGIKTMIPETGNSTTEHSNETQTSDKDDGLVLQSVVQPSSVTSDATVTQNSTLPSLNNAAASLLSNGTSLPQNATGEVSPDISDNVNINGRESMNPGNTTRAAVEDSLEEKSGNIGTSESHSSSDDTSNTEVQSTNNTVAE